MLGRRDHTSITSDENARGWRWPRSSRALRRERERAEAELIADVRWQWRSACGGTSLKQLIYTPSGPTVAVPRIGHIDVGPPITFTVRVRPGQTIDDFIAAAPLIAPAMNAAKLHITPVAPQWLRIVLLPASQVIRSSGRELEALTYGA